MSDSPKTAEYSPMPRRGALRSLAGLAVLPCLPPASPPPPADPASAILELPSHGHWRITHNGGGWSAEPVPRWEVPAIAAAEQPLPAFTEVSWFVTSMIFRWWEPGDVSRCRLCARCNASVTGRGAHPGLAICVRETRGQVADEEAPLHRGGREVTLSNEECESNFLGRIGGDDEDDDEG